MEYRVNKRENVYFILKVIFTLAIVFGLILVISSINRRVMSSAFITIITFAVYIAAIILFIFIQKVFLVAHLKGDGVHISERQFPEVYRIYSQMVNDLGLKRAPKLFLLQQGGLLNAFAVRFSGKNYIAIYSDVFSILNSDLETLKFVIGHELGHVKRKHMSKRFWTFPSLIIPFLGAAYSRSCEYTCDAIGAALGGGNARRGLVLLAAGKELYKNIDIENYVEEAKLNYSLSVKMAGLFMSHPYLPKRIQYLGIK